MADISIKKAGVIRDARGSKLPLREKFVEIYAAFFRGENPATSSSNFWNDLFLLKVNASYLNKSVESMSEPQLFIVKDNIQQIFINSINIIESNQVNTDKSDTISVTRKFNALETLRIFLGAIFMKRLPNFSYDILDLLTGLNKANSIFPGFISLLATIIVTPGETMDTRASALRLMGVLVRGNLNINQNSLNGYFMQKDIFFSIIEFINDPETEQYISEAVLLIDILANYQKNETRNPYQDHLRNTKQRSVLQIIIKQIQRICAEATSHYAIVRSDEETTMQTVGAYVGWIFGRDSATKKRDEDGSERAFEDLPPSSTAILLPLYDLLCTNKMFLTTFTQCSSPPNAILSDDYPPTPLESFFSLASYLFEHNNGPRATSYSGLALMNILIMCEDEVVCTRFCDTNCGMRVKLCRQKEPVLPKIKRLRPAASIILDLTIIFINHNLRKKLDTYLYRLNLLIIHRLIYRLRKERIRLACHWTELWQCIIRLTRFLTSHSADLIEIDGFVDIVEQVICLINFVISYGDVFLDDPNSYDKLFYEIVQSGSIFDQLRKLVPKPETEWTNRRGTGKGPTDMTNIRKVITHFSPLIDEYASDKGIKNPTAEQAIAIINQHYDTLELVPLDKLDECAHNEIPKEAGFLRHCLRIAVADWKDTKFLELPNESRV